MAANEVTFSVNASDVTRYATKPGDALWPPFLCHPLATTIVSIFGILVTSSSSVILGEVATLPQPYLGTLLTYKMIASVGPNEYPRSIPYHGL